MPIRGWIPIGHLVNRGDEFLGERPDDRKIVVLLEGLNGGARRRAEC